MIFFKRDLLETDYHWNTNMSSSVPVPSASFFNRFSGVDILHMINLFNNLIVSLTLLEGQKIESMLVNEMPLQINDEISVFNWLKTYYRPITI